MNRLAACFLLLSMIVGFSHGFGFSKQTTITASNAGDSVSTLISIGDVNGDKFQDFTIRSPDPGLYIVLGSANATNPATVGTGMPYFVNAADNTASISWAGRLGDIDKDGFDDFILLDDTYTISYLIYGMASFPAQTDVSALVNPAGSTITGITVYDFAGGDFNKDGHGDLAFSDYADGSVKVIFGGATRFPSTIDFTTLLSTAKFTVTGFPSGSVILALNPAGDVNNDGYEDLIVGSPTFTYSTFANGGGAVIYGGATLTDYDASTPSSRGITYYCSDNSRNSAGEYFRALKDFNGDGVNDIIILSSYNTGVNNTAYVIFGNSSLPNLLDVCSLSAGAAMTIVSEIDDALGDYNTDSGDFNGDGFTDVIIGAYTVNKVYIFFGSANPPSVFRVATDSPFTFNGASYLTGTDDRFGGSLAAVDLNGDGNLDAAIRSDQKVFVFFGDAPTPSTSITASTSQSVSPTISNTLSTSVSPSENVVIKPPKKTKSKPKKKTPTKKPDTPKATKSHSASSAVNISLMAVLGMCVAPLMRFIFA